MELLLNEKFGAHWHIKEISSMRERRYIFFNSFTKYHSIPSTNIFVDCFCIPLSLIMSKLLKMKTKFGMQSRHSHKIPTDEEMKVGIDHLSATMMS